MDPFEILGQTIVNQATGRRVIGDGGFGSGSGFDSSFLINAASELAQRGVNTYEDEQKKQKAQADAQAQLAKAITADANWASAEAMLDLANQAKDPSRIAPAQALQSSAASKAASVGVGLPTDAVAKRVAAAQDAANKAAQDALASPKDTLKQATMRAWQKVAAQAGALSAGPLAPSGGTHGGGHHGNWLTKQWGPMPVWGWGLTAVGVVGVGALVVHLVRR